MYVSRVPLSVLLVEDEPDLVHVMSLSLTRAGFDVVSCGTGEEAVAVLAGQDIDVMVVDRGLPDGDGLELVRRVRGDGFRGSVMVASGHSGIAHDEECREAGADEVLRKPFRLADLVARLNGIAGPQLDAAVCS